MWRLAFLLLLTGCIPTFETATPQELELRYNGTALELVSDKPILRGSIGVRADSVTSALCASEGCVPDAKGRVLLRLPEGRQWGLGVILGRVEGLEHARASIVRVGEQRAVVDTWTEP
jgi:hypothetical protein